MYFLANQADRKEVLEINPASISVLFLDSYKLKGSEVFSGHPALCPLNSQTGISSTYRTCRRCFNGDAQEISYT